MTLAKNPRSHLALVESLLVEQFRALQSLISVTRAERNALVSANAAALLELLPRKQAIQADLNRLEADRAEAVAAWGQAMTWTGASLTLAELVGHLEPEAAERFRSLREGVLALAQELKALNQGNHSLALSALERVAAVRDFMVSLSETSEGYQPWSGGRARAGTLLTMEQWA